MRLLDNEKSERSPLVRDRVENDESDGVEEESDEGVKEIRQDQ